MKARQLFDGIYWVGAVDWDRRLFDSLVPLPEGTSYNAYLVRGTQKTALIDTVEPRFGEVLFARLASLGVDHIDYVIANHAEQDHSGCLPRVLERFPEAHIVCTPRARKMLLDLLDLSAAVFHEVEDGDQLALGERTLQFIHFPWVHWPETMLTYLPESRVLFPCDLFGSHWATNTLVATDGDQLRQAAKLYFAEIMMPFRDKIEKNLPRVEELALDLIAPSHGPAIGDAAAMLDAYRRWVSDRVANRVAIPYISMHESTRLMVDHLIEALTDHQIQVERLDLENLDAGKLALAMVDAATIVFGTPTVLMSAHPNVMYAVHLASLLKPKARHIGIIGSFGWGGRVVDQIHTTLAGPTGAELLEPILTRGTPDAQTRAALEALAATIAERHASMQLDG